MNKFIDNTDSTKYVIHWFRRDLRLEDNVALSKALNSGMRVIPVFIFDTNIIDKLSDKNDARVTFIYQQLKKINTELINKYHSGLVVLKGTPTEVFGKLITQYTIDSVYTNNDYEPYAIKRDKYVELFLINQGIHFKSYKDHVIFERDNILKLDSSPYTVFTPYKKRWIDKFKENYIENNHPNDINYNFIDVDNLKFPELKEIGFNERVGDFFPAIIDDIKVIRNYDETRDFPAMETTKIGLHLRFGTVSIRKIVKIAFENNDTWLSELIWREFFMQILYHFPYVENSSFKTKYNNIEWRNNEAEFELWCKGKTGYPLVDAGMRELNATGFMHNRVRMVTASFLCKHLLIDWRWGEAYFAEKLLDYELASNNGNWQWAAGTGCDAAPYFRIFNPTIQLSKFDPEKIYVKKWVEEIDSIDYKPIVEHRFATERCLKAYKKALG